MNRQLALFFLCTVVWLSSCGGGSSAVSQDGGDTVAFRYAEHISAVKYPGYIKVELADPWKPGRTLHTYILVPRQDKLPDGLPQGTVVRTPVERSVVFSTAHCQLLYYLGAQDAIAGVCDLKYILIPDVQRRAALSASPASARPIVDCGEGLAPMTEKIIDLRADALLLSPFENSGGYGKLEKTGIPLIEAADYMETSALGRAEWMKFYGMLYGKERQADSLFNIVDSTYNSLKAVAARLPKGRSVLTERKTGSVWYCPGGRSSIGLLIADANGRYAFSADRHSGSLPLPFEQVLDEAGNTDVWAFKFNGEKPMTRADLLAEYHGYESMKAFRTGEIYECNCTVTPYFEETSFRPDYLLRDFIQLLHPGTDLGGLRYYRKL
ncbi:iron complex transport system substrate-binding protein [Prevotellaceae bacterium KH2P17]|nr:iron complex transport system substrate-binding protein [Prevotellaceae bacterium KH2P17]